jgi:hypothetical protein
MTDINMATTPAAPPMMLLLLLPALVEGARVMRSHSSWGQVRHMRAQSGRCAARGAAIFKTVFQYHAEGRHLLFVQHLGLATVEEAREM